MRRNFAQVLKAGKIDLKNEYSKLFDLFYGKGADGKSLADLISLNFEDISFRGTCLDLDEFDQQFEFHFDEHPQNFDVDYLVSFCEYVYNFVIHFDSRFFWRRADKNFYIHHILKVIEEIGYMQSSEDDFAIFVPKDSVAIAVSKLDQIPENVSYRIIAYNHHSMDIESKKQTLLVLAHLLEPHDKKLNQIDAPLKKDLFYAFNNFNLRHNNIDPADKGHYKKVIAEMPQEELERWYDRTYQMCLMAFMRLEHAAGRPAFDELQARIDAKT